MKITAIAVTTALLGAVAAEGRAGPAGGGTKAAVESPVRCRFFRSTSRSRGAW